MSNLARAWAEKQAPGGGCQMHLLEVVAAFHSDDLGFCTASNRYLAARLRKSEATIERGLKGLEDCGLIERDTTRWGPDGGARRRISLKGYCPVAMQRELDERKALAKARRAARQAGMPPVRSPQDEGQVPSFCGSGPLTLGGTESLEESLDKGSSGPGGPAPQSGASEPNFTRELFDRGTGELVRMTDRPPDRARALIGSWRQIAGDDATVLAAIDAAVAAGDAVRDPAQWIEGRIRRQRDEAPRRSPAPASPAATAGRAAEAMRMAERGEWPIGGTVWVEADSPEGQAWTEHYSRFGVSPRWIGGGWRMPSLQPPALVGA